MVLVGNWWNLLQDLEVVGVSDFSGVGPLVRTPKYRPVCQLILILHSTSHLWIWKDDARITRVLDIEFTNYHGQHTDSELDPLLGKVLTTFKTGPTRGSFGSNRALRWALSDGVTRTVRQDHSYPFDYFLYGYESCRSDILDLGSTVSDGMDIGSHVYDTYPTAWLSPQYTGRCRNPSKNLAFVTATLFNIQSVWVHHIFAGTWTAPKVKTMKIYASTA